MSPDRPDTPDAASAPAWRRRMGPAVVAAVCVAAGAAVVWWMPPFRPPASPPALPGDGRYDRHARPPGDPADWLTSRPAGLGGFVEIAAWPADVPMPVGATRQSLVGRGDGQGEWIKAEYLAAGPLADVAAEMDRALDAAGWRQAGGQTGPALATRLLCKDARVLSVRLHKRGDFVKIVAIVQRVGPSGPEHG